MPLAQLRVLAGALMLSLVLIVNALWLIAAPEATDPPPTGWLAGVLGFGVVLAVLLETIGYRVVALPASTPSPAASGQALARFRQAMMMRFALANSVAVVSVALSFVVETGGLVLAVVGCVISEVLLAIHVWPWRRPVDRTAAALEADGARSGLREALGFRSDGVVREL